VDAVHIAIRRGVVEVVHRDRANREPGTCLFVHNTVDDQSKHGDPGERDAWAESVGSQFAAYINGRIEIGEVKKASLDLSMKKQFYIT
jgi:hypothetical protein